MPRAPVHFIQLASATKRMALTTSVQKVSAKTTARNLNIGTPTQAGHRHEEGSRFPSAIRFVGGRTT